MIPIIPVEDVVAGKFYDEPEVEIDMGGTRAKTQKTIELQKA